MFHLLTPQHFTGRSTYKIDCHLGRGWEWLWSRSWSINIIGGRPQSPSPPSQNKNALCNQQDEQENQAGRVLSMNVHVPQWNNSGFIIIM